MGFLRNASHTTVKSFLIFVSGEQHSLQLSCHERSQIDIVTRIISAQIDPDGVSHMLLPSRMEDECVGCTKR